MHLSSSSMISALLLIFPVGIAAAEPANGAASYQEINAFVTAWPATCKAMLQQTLANPQLKPIIEATPDFESIVCTCVENRMKSDQYLGLLFTLPLATFRAKVDQTKFQLYLIGKMVSFTMACGALELDRSTNNINPSNGG